MKTDTAALAAVAGASMIWGVAPVYFRALHVVPPLEMLSHRVVWTCLTFGLLLAWQGRLGQLRALVTGPERGHAAIAAGLIAVNWGVFIWALNAGHAIEASLGYYIFPMVAVLFGVVFRGEWPGRLQWLAVALAASGVAVLTFGLGLPPWVALILAVSFAFYGLVKSRISVPADVSVTVEALVLLPLALVWLGLSHARVIPGGGVFGADWSVTLLLALSGFVTGIPLILFTRGSQGLRMSTVGMMQYLNPTLQAVIAITVFGDPLTRWHLIAFGLIWAGLAVYSAAAVAADRAASRPAPSEATSGTVVMKSSSDESAKPSPTT